MCTRVLALLAALHVGFAYCFNWDIVVSGGKQLQFYNNGTLTHTEDIPSARSNIYSIIYDPVHYRVLFAYTHAGGDYRISSFNLTTLNIQSLIIKKSSLYILVVAYDPFTQLLFWKEGPNIYSFSLNPASYNKTVDGNLIITLDYYCNDIAVDICGRYIYWITGYEIGRARYDGSEREGLMYNIDSYRLSLAIDQQTQKVYWIERDNDNQVSIESVDFNGTNRSKLFTIKNASKASSLTVSKDFIYWNSNNQDTFWKLPKNQPQQSETKIITSTDAFNEVLQVIAAKYTIMEQIKQNQNCKAIHNLIPNELEPNCIDMLCVHGTKVSGESRCECTQGFTGERCDISVCTNYCLQGNCSVSAEGQPKCSCNAGYSGERCEVNSCHKHCLNNGICSLNEEDEPVCECTADYNGERCGVPTCKDNCVSAERQTKYRSNDSNYEAREVNACHQFCLNNGICSLDKEDKPVCQCTADYEGERCDVPAFLIKCFLYAYKNIPPVTLSKGEHSTCSSTVV